MGASCALLLVLKLNGEMIIVKRLNELLDNVNDNTVYIADYHYWTDGMKLSTCKTCTVAEFLKELTEHEPKTMAQIIRNVKFRRF